jgi:hypothetical protein
MPLARDLFLWCGHLTRRSVRAVMRWLPLLNGDGTPRPWFEALGSMVYATSDHPAGASVFPWFQIRDGMVFPVAAHPDGPSNEPAYRIVGATAVPVRRTDLPVFTIEVTTSE